MYCILAETVFQVLRCKPPPSMGLSTAVYHADVKVNSIMSIIMYFQECTPGIACAYLLSI